MKKIKELAEITGLSLGVILLAVMGFVAIFVLIVGILLALAVASPIILIVWLISQQS